MSTSSASASSSSFSFLSENIFSNYYNNNNNNSLILRMLLVTGLGGLVAGFFIGRAFSRGGGGRGITVSTASRTQGDGDEDAIVNANANANAHATANTNEECKLVLVARTDLGMTKGIYYCVRRSIFFSNIFLARQNRGSVFTCYACLLQGFTKVICYFFAAADITEVGAVRTGKGGGAGQERGRAGDASGASYESGSCCEDYT